MNLAEIPQIQALTIREKLELVDEIWKSVLPESDSLEVTEEERQLLDDRWSGFVAAPDSALGIEEFKDRLKAFRA